MSNIFETDNYAVKVGPSEFTDVKADMYLLVNKTTGVIEAEHRVLGYAKSWCKEFETILKESEAKELGFSKMPGPPPPDSKL